MKRHVLMVAGTLVLAGCTSTTPAEDTAPGPGHGDRGDVAVATSLSEDLLSDRVVVALYADPEVDDEQLEAALMSAAEQVGVTARTVSANVLDLASLRGEAPDVVASLPEGASPETASKVVRSLPVLDGVYHRFTTQARVHDIRLRVTPERATPEEVLAALAREGVLADSFGDHTADLSNGQVVVTYVGPVLSDAQVRVVRDVMAEAAGVSPGQVTVAPGTPGPYGLSDPAATPGPEPAPPTEASRSRGGGHG